LDSKPKHQTRTRIAQGCYLGPADVLIVARLGSTKTGTLREARFYIKSTKDASGVPYSRRNNSEPLKIHLQLQEGLKDARREAPAVDSLAAAIDRYLAARPKVAKTRGNEEAHACLPPWKTTELARLPVADVRRKAIRKQLEAWLEAGGKDGDPLAPTTVNRRKHFLAKVLAIELDKPDDPDDAILPTANIPACKPRPEEERGMPLPIVALILAAMPDRGRAENGKRAAVSLTKVRLSVEAWTGLTHKSLVRLERKRIDWKLGRIFYPARKKGKGAKGIWADLLPPGLEALQQFDALNLWHMPFSRSSAYKTFTRAVVTARARLEADSKKDGPESEAAELLALFDRYVPEKCRPYDLRHSFLTEVYRHDPVAASEIAQHQDPKTTRRYTRAAVSDRVEAAIDKMRAHWFPETVKPTAVVRKFSVVPKQA